MYALVALGLLLCVTFPDVVFRGRTLLTSPYAGSVMGAQPPYGYRWRPPRFNLYIRDPGASAWQYEPMTAKASQLYQHGVLPLWNANQGFGAPLAANMHSSVFYPLALPLLLAPTPAMWDTYLLGRLLLAGVFTFLFLRSLEIGWVGAFGAAAAFMLCGYFMLWINESWLNVDALLPALLYGVERVVQTGARRWILFLAGAVCLAFLGGMPESTFVVVMFAAAYAAFRLGEAAIATRAWRATARRAIVLVLAMLLGAGASAFLLAPFAEYVQSASHSHRPEHAQGLSHGPTVHLVSIFLPYVDGPPLGHAPTLYYAGVVGPLLGAVALARSGHRHFRLACFFFAAAVLGMAKAYGVVINEIGALPVFDRVNFWRHLGIVICLAFAVQAGIGLEVLIIRRVTGRRAVVAALLASAGIAALLLLFWWKIGIRVKTPQLVSSVGVAAALALATILALAFVTRAATRVAVAAVVLLIADLVHLAPRSARPYRYPADAAPPAVSGIREEIGAERIFSVDGVLYPNTASYFGLNDVRALDALYPSRYFAYVRELVDPSLIDRFTGLHGSDTPLEPVTRCHRNPWFDLAGVKYVVAPHGKALAGCQDEASLITRILAKAQPANAVKRSAFLIDGVPRQVLFQHPPSEVRFTAQPRPDRATLAFSVALDPAVWDAAKGDGVTFSVSVVADGRQTTLFTRWVDPKNRHEDRRWIDGAVDLERYVGRDVQIVLATAEGADSAWDWAGWGDIRLRGRADTEVPQYAVAWEGADRSDLTVYRNSTAFPRAFLAYSAEPARDAQDALDRMKALRFDPRRTVLLEDLPPDAARALAPNGSSPNVAPVEIVRYEDSRVELRATAAAPAALVLTDVFYPGWTARVDGVDARIFPANAAFRAVLLSPGPHVVEFLYRPRSFMIGLVVSLISVSTLAAMFTPVGARVVRAGWAASSR